MLLADYVPGLALQLQSTADLRFPDPCSRHAEVPKSCTRPACNCADAFRLQPAPSDNECMAGHSVRQQESKHSFRPSGSARPHLTLKTKLRMEKGAIRSPMPRDAASRLPKRLSCCLPAADVSCRRAAAASEVEAQLPAASSPSCGTREAVKAIQTGCSVSHIHLLKAGDCTLSCSRFKQSICSCTPMPHNSSQCGHVDPDNLSCPGGVMQQTHA